MRNWFASDLHFHHNLMISDDYESLYRDYATKEEMTEGITRIWNSQVNPEDTVYIIGDFSFVGKNKTKEIVDGLNGHKILIKGNHDSSNTIGGCNFEQVHSYLEEDFDIGDIRQRICMFHFPIYSWNRAHYGSWHLHGHLHGNPVPVPGKILDVGWDAHGRLLSLEDVAAIMETKPSRNNHHEKQY